MIYLDSLKSSRNVSVIHVAKALINLFDKYLKERIPNLNKENKDEEVFLKNTHDNNNNKFKATNAPENNTKINFQKSIFCEEDLEKLSIKDNQKKQTNELNFLNYNFNCCELTPILDNQIFKKSKWKVYIAEAPYQKNSFDCGIFLCKYLDYLSRRVEFDFTNYDMPYFRMLIAIELVNGELITR